MSPECSPRLAWLLRTRFNWNMATPTMINRVTKDRITGREMLWSTTKLLESYFGVRTTLDRRHSCLRHRRVMVGCEGFVRGSRYPPRHLSGSFIAKCRGRHRGSRFAGFKAGFCQSLGSTPSLGLPPIH